MLPSIPPTGWTEGQAVDVGRACEQRLDVQAGASSVGIEDPRRSGWSRGWKEKGRGLRWLSPPHTYSDGVGFGNRCSDQISKNSRIII